MASSGTSGDQACPDQGAYEVRGDQQGCVAVS